MKVKRLQSDNGGEYDNKRSHAWFDEIGIQWEPTVPHTPEQNGVSESLNRWLMDRVRSILFDKSLNARLWAEVANTVIYLKNCSPTTSPGGRTPYEAWHGCLPNVAHLRALECVAFVHTPKEKRKKLDLHSRKCIFLGYMASNIFSLCDPVARQLLRARDVVFNEAASFRAGWTLGIDNFVKSSPLLLQVNVPGSSGSQSALNEVPAASPVPKLPQPDSRLSPTTPNDPEPTRQVDDAIPLSRPSHEASKAYEEEEGIGQLPETPVRTPSTPAKGPATLAPSFRDPQSPQRVEPRVSQRANKGKLPAQFLGMATMTELLDTPRMAEEVRCLSDRVQWEQAIEDELQSLEKHHTWDLVKLPPRKRALSGKWVFKKKLGPNGCVSRFKARWIVQGYEQQHGLDYDQTFAAIVKPASI
jgi:hypothetical protein